MIHFLSSYPKSGNTWVRAFLMAYKFGTVDLGRLDFVVGDNQTRLFQLSCPMPYDKVGLYDWACIRLTCLVSMLASRVYTPFIVKTHNCNAVISDVPLIPDGLTGNSVCILRDPRDVVLSYASHMGKTIDKAIDELGNRNNGVKADSEKGNLPVLYSSWSEHIKSWVKRKNTLVVRYEDLLSDPEPNFKKILDHYGLDYTQEEVLNAIELASFDRLQKAEDDGGFKENSAKQDRFFRRGTAGGWREDLTEEQVRKIEEAHGEEMVKWGYELSLEKAA